MKKWVAFACILLLLPVILNAQVITTYASGPLVYDLQQLAFDRNGNLYCATGYGNTIIKIDTVGTVTIFAGTGTNGYSGDGGPATAAKLGQPGGVTTDTLGNVYIADAENNRIRKVNATTGIITTIAGSGYGAPDTGGYSGDGGPAILAEFFWPGGLCFDKYGNLYVTDYRNNRIRKIDTSGIITTVAGNGTPGYTGDNGPATTAECITNFNVCIDAFGNLFFIDLTGTVRKVDTAGIISTIAGDSTGTWTYAGDGVPALGAPIAPLAITFDENGLLVIADGGNERIRRIDNSGIIHTIAGDGIAGDAGDGGPADSAELYTPDGIAFDQCGNLYITQVDEPRIRKVAFNPDCWPASVKSIATNTVTIYPNPAYDVINIDNVQKEETYVLLNISGIIEQSGTLKTGGNSISVLSLPPGMYFLELKDEQGNKTIKKIVKE